MIKKSAPQAACAASANSEQMQIEAAISRLTGVRSEIYSRMDEIIKKFDELSQVRQVRVNELLKNPFKLEMFMDSLNKTPNENNPELIIEKQLSQQASSLQLVSIMKSDKGNCCMIDDKVLYEGDIIKGFKVRQIKGNFVKIESQGVEIVLKLAE